MQEVIVIRLKLFQKKDFKKLLTLFIVYGIIYIELRLTLDSTENRSDGVSPMLPEEGWVQVARVSRWRYIKWQTEKGKAF